MKSRRVGLSSFIYTEWLRPIADYYLTIKINEAMFEIILPAIAAVVCTCLYYIYGDVNCALRALADFLLGLQLCLLLCCLQVREKI